MFGIENVVFSIDNFSVTLDLKLSSFLVPDLLKNSTYTLNGEKLRSMGFSQLSLNWHKNPYFPGLAGK